MKVLSLVIIILSVFVSCKKQTATINNLVADESSGVVISEEKKHTIAYFPNALTYQFEQNGEVNELWFYVNEDTKQLLYVPNDDMIEAVISYPDGTYKIFGTTERGERQIMEQRVDINSHNNIESDVLKPLPEKRTISQQNIQQKDLECSGYYLKYLKMEGGETLFVTTEIPINSYQLYGFSNLDGDAKLPIHIDFKTVFNQKQLLTHIERDGFSLKLLNYGPNPYEFDLRPYQNK